MALLIGTVSFVWSMAIRGIVSKDANRTLGILLGIAGAALLAGHVATAQVPIRDAAAGAQLQTVTRILRPGVEPADDDGITRVPSAVDEAPAAGDALAASAGLTINPIFDSTILSDPNAALIEATIYAAIADFQSKFSDPITVTINFKLMTTGLGQSSTYFGNLPYSTYLAALKADAKTGNDFTAIALLPSLSTNPVSGSSTINVTLPNLRAVGIAANPQPGQPDGIVYVNTKITNPGSPGTSGQFSLLTTLEHEIDEVLGLVSSLPDRPLNTIFSQDLYRYDQFGMRSFATGSNKLAYFSIDGVTRLAQYDNQNDGGDPGDWQSNPLPSGVSPKVQDAFATPGASPALSVELTALDVIGFDRASSAVPVSVTSLTPNVTSPVTVGTPITWTAIASGGTPPLQYQFLRFTDGVGWTMAQSYSSNNSYIWFPPAGTHALQVWVRNSGSSASYDAWLGTGTFTVLAPTARVTSFNSDVAFPAPVNMPIMFTAAATAGAAPVEYKFWRYTAAGGWTLARDYTSSNVYTWYPPEGSNAVQVWVRAVGSTVSYQDLSSIGPFDVVVPPTRLTAITSNVAFPAAPTTTIRWTAIASGAGPFEYKFFRYNQSSGWVVLRDWNQSNQASWTPGVTNIGENALQVWVRTVGSNVTYEDWRGTGSFLIATPQVDLTPNRALTGLRVGNLITWTASVSGVAGPWEYKFIAFDGTTWRVMRDYSTQATFSWFPPAGTCALQVWVRTVGSTANLDQYQSSGFFVVNP